MRQRVLDIPAGVPGPSTGSSTKRIGLAGRTLLFLPLPPPFAGPEIFSAQLVEALKEREPGLLVRNASVRSENLDKGKLDLSGVWGFLKALGRFVAAVTRPSVKLVYVVLSAGKVGFLRDMVLIGCSRLLGRHVVGHLHGANYRNFSSSAPAPLRALVRHTWGSLSAAIVLSDSLRDQMSAAPKVRTFVLSNGLKAAEFPAKETYDRGRVVITFLGYLSFTKGFYDLIRVHKDLAGRHHRVLLNFAGERPKPSPQLAEFLDPSTRRRFEEDFAEITREMQEFTAQAEKHNAVYWGVVSGEKKRELLRSGSVFVLPSYREGLSIALLEAMFSGLAIVTTRTGAAPDIIQDGVNGFLVEPGDQTGLRERLERFIRNPELCERMGRANAALAREKFTIERIADEFLNILRNV